MSHRLRKSQSRVALLLVGVATCCSGCNTYTTAAKIGLQIVGDAVAEDATREEFKQLSGRTIREADQRYGTPRNVLVDAATGREIRVYGVQDDPLGQKRWLVEAQAGWVDSVSMAQVNPDLGTDQAKALLLEQVLRGKKPEQVRATPVADRMIFDSKPRNLKHVPGGELVQVYNVTSFLDVVGSRYIVLVYDAAERCQEIRFVGTP